jgi:hypothetical protein
MITVTSVSARLYSTLHVLLSGHLSWRAVLPGSSVNLHTAAFTHHLACTAGTFCPHSCTSQLTLPLLQVLMRWE